jgi:hypothetical protein
VSEWVKRVGVNDSGNVFVEVKPEGFMILSSSLHTTALRRNVKIGMEGVDRES